MEPLIEFKSIRVEIIEAYDECAKLFHKVTSGNSFSCFSVIIKGLSSIFPISFDMKKSRVGYLEMVVDIDFNEASIHLSFEREKWS